MALVDVRDNSEHREQHAVFFPCTNGCSSPVKCPLPGKLKDCSGSISAGGGIDLCKTFSVRIRGIARIEEFG